MIDTSALPWIGNGLILAATYLLARKRKICLVYYSLGNVLYIVWAFQHQIWGVVALDGVLTGLNVRAWIAWNLEEKP